MRKILIIIVILLILTLIGLWGYLLLNGAPQNGNDTFTPASADDATESSFANAPTTPVEVTTQIPVDQPLVELSSRPTAGAVFVEHDGGGYVRYVERGTGHIYEIDLESGVTTRISNTTIPRTTDAVWSKVGTRVALTSEISSGRPEVLMGTLVRGDSGEQTLQTFALHSTARNVAFLDSGDAFYYTTDTVEGLRGQRYDLKTGAETTLFSVPLREATMVWDTTGGSAHYIYTNPTAVMQGYVYSIENNTLGYVTEGARALTVGRVNERSLMLTTLNGAALGSEVLNTETRERSLLNISALPEKCAIPLQSGQSLWCTSTLSLPQAVYPDAWYQGAVKLSDSLFKIDEATGNWTLIDLNLLAERALDALSLSQNADGTRLLFINKTDGALWMANVGALTTTE